MRGQMRCEDALEAMSARFDGELAPGESADLSAHLAGCSSCRAQETALGPVARRLRGAALEQPEMPLFAKKRIAALVSAPQPRRSPFVFGLAFLGATAGLAGAAVVARARPATPSEIAHVGGHELAAERCLIADPLTRSPLAAACAAGGLPGAKLAMQEIVRRARARGLKLECRTCHRSESRFDLRDDARIRLDELLANAT